jgi:alpha-tubulin suppressor-like RCC1 family protein
MDVVGRPLDATMTTMKRGKGSNKRPRGLVEDTNETDSEQRAMNFFFATWPAEIISHLISFLPTQSLPSFAASCRACNEAVAHDEHWQERYLNRWHQPTVEISSWRTQFKNSHNIDGILYVCGLRAAPGDNGPPGVIHSELYGAEGQPVEADFYSTMSHRLRFTQATPGACHFLGVSDGSLYAWGSPLGLRNSGVRRDQIHRVSMGILPRIGDPISTPTVVPTCCDGTHHHPIYEAGKIKQIHIAGCGEQRCAMITQCGDLYYFGREAKFVDECPIPTFMMSILDMKLQRVRVASVALGEEHGLFVDVTGRVFSVGDNDLGQLGIGHTNTVGHATLLQTLVEEGVIVTSVAAGMNHSLCLSSVGKVYAFGDNGRGQLGCGSDEGFHLVPTQVLTSSSESSDDSDVVLAIASVSAGFNLSAFVTTDGTLYTCGQGNEGGLGLDLDLGPFGFVNIPQQVSDLEPHHVTCISVGGGHMVALTSDGLCFAWGNNDHGQCGRDLSEEDEMRSGVGRGWHEDGRPNGISVYDVAQVALPARVRYVCAGDNATFFILGEPLRQEN